MKVMNLICEEILNVMKCVSEVELDAMVLALDQHHRIFLFGEGRTGYVTRCFAMRLKHMGYEVYFVGETITPSIQEDDLFIVISGSGESSVSLAYTSEVVRKQASIIAITKHPESSIGVLANLTVRLGSGESQVFENTIQPLNSLFDQSLHVFLDAICVLLTQKHNMKQDNIRASHW